MIRKKSILEILTIALMSSWTFIYAIILFRRRSRPSLRIPNHQKKGFDEFIKYYIIASKGMVANKSIQNWPLIQFQAITFPSTISCPKSSTYADLKVISMSRKKQVSMHRFPNLNPKPSIDFGSKETCTGIVKQLINANNITIRSHFYFIESLGKRMNFGGSGLRLPILLLVIDLCRWQD